MQNSSELISIIVPVYNCEKYLPQCIESLCSQTHKMLEIILVNDGSTDNCLTICNGFAAKDQRIKIVNQENKGVAYARNSGLKVAKGEYIGFVDADDFVAPTMYEHLYKLAVSHKADTAACGFIRDEAELNTFTETPQNIQEFSVTEALEYFYPNLIVCNKLFAKHLFKDILFPTDTSLVEDIAVCLRLLAASKCVVATSSPYYFYRRNAQSATAFRAWNPKHIGYFKQMDIVLKYTQDNKLTAVNRDLRFHKISTAVSFCVHFMGVPDFEKNAIKEIQSILRKNILFFCLHGKVKLVKKLFAVLVCINWPMAKLLYRPFKRANESM